MTPLDRRSGTLRLGLFALTALFVLGFESARAAEKDASRGPGFVDGSAFAELAGEDEIVEINIGGALLRALSRADPEEQGLGEVMRGLQSINAYIVGLQSDPQRVEKASRMVRDMEAKLERQGWERLAVVRQKADRVNIYVRSNGETIDGLVVLALDRDQSQVVFANIAGTIDLARLGELSESLDLPGLEGIKDAGKNEKKKNP